ncbi:MAG: hypothetical protein KUG82_11165 [Pseudomonadales bacterium]|nr:hypothetical protein [Pseudomonadales bacterium]
MELFFFSNERLFGSYHSASEITSTRLLIICPPLFDEYRRCYKALVDLANGCASKGMHVIRFDYLGTGESFGNLLEVEGGQWVKDLDDCIEEGLALTGAESVTLLGVRFGATIAAQSVHNQISRYVFWDPITSGLDYIHYIEELNQQLKQQHIELAKIYNVKTVKDNATDSGSIDTCYQAFSYSDDFKMWFESLTLDAKRCENKADTQVIRTGSTSVYENSLDNNIYTNCTLTNFDYGWPMFDVSLLSPKPVLEAIAEKVLKL